MPHQPTSINERTTEADQIKFLTGFGKLLPFYIFRSKDGIRIQLFPLKIFYWISCLSISIYLGGGIALYLNDRFNNNLKNISLFDRLYPPNWKAYSVSRGDSYIENSIEALESGNFSKAFHQTRVGLARSPANLQGRTLLADMFVAAGRNDLAESTLLDGLPFHGSDSDYLKKTITFLFRLKRDHAVITICEDLLSDFGERKQEEGESSTQFLVTSLAGAYIHRGNFDQAEETLTKYELSNSKDGRFLLALIEWNRGYKDLALALIEQISKEFPTDQQYYRTLVRWQLEHSLTNTARRTSLLRRLAFPEQYLPRIDLLYAYDASNEATAVSRETEEFFRDFGNNSEALLVLGDFAANSGRPAIAKKVFSKAQEIQLPLQGPALMLVESEIVAENYESAVQRTRSLIDTYPEWETQFAPVFNGLQAIAHYALGDRESASLYLDSFLNLKSVRADNLVAVAKRLVTVGAKPEARRVLDQAVKADALNQTALAQLIEFDLAEANSPDLPANLRLLLKMRRPSPDLMQSAYARLGRDRFMFVDDRDSLLDDIADTARGRTTAPKDSSLN